jgi:aminodeoxyfutalosine deaminase
LRDPELVSHLAERGVPLEVCPTSNIATRAVDRLENHPIRQMYDAGITVTVNSDDPPMFGTTLNREYEIAARLLDLDEDGIAGLAANAVRASYLDGPAKAELLAEIDSHLAAHPDGGSDETDETDLSP